MKKILFFILCLVVILLPLDKTLADADQYNPCVNTDPTMNISGSQAIGQTFRPSGSKLNTISVLITGGGVGQPVGTANVKVFDQSSNIIAQTSANYISTSLWVDFTFNDVNIIAEQNYKFTMTTTTTNAGWYYKPSNTYDRGNSVINSINDLNKDFAFAVYSSNPYSADPEETSTTTTTSTSTSSTTESATTTTISDNQTTVNTQTTESTTQRATTTTPSSPTATTVTQSDASITAPAGLVLSNSTTDNELAVGLTWMTPENKDIDGFKVFRSTQTDSDFLEIGTAAKDKTKYTDTTVKYDTKYYYYIVSYKGDKLSDKSNISFITVKKAESNVDSSIKDVKKNSYLWLYYVLGAILAIIAGIIAYLMLAKKLNLSQIYNKVREKLVKITKE